MTERVHRVCTLCEANCGLVFEVEGNRIESVRPDRNDPFSEGYACPKGMAIAALHDDPDRLRGPMRRRADGEFEAIGWEEALDLAAQGLARVRDTRGEDAVAVYWGNPIIHNHGALLVRRGVTAALRTRNMYGAGSQDVSPRFATSYYLYGSSLALPVPDVDETDFLLCVGANPVVSNGSVLTAPDLRGRLRRLRARGGKLVVVDPRRTETAAEADQHIPIRPGQDAAFLLALTALVVREGKADETFLREHTVGFEAVLGRLRKLDIEACAHAAQVPESTLVTLAREFGSRASVCYSRIGVCNNRTGTLGTYATDLLNIVAGRLGQRGGALFPTPAIDAARVIGLTGDDGHARWHTRVRQLPETLGELPTAALAEEIETPGPKQVRGFLSFAGNPVLSAPNGRRIDAALEKLDFMVSVDLYVNETTRHADLILPPAGVLTEEHYDLFFPLMSIRNRVRRSPPVVGREPGQLHDTEILVALARRLGGGPTGIGAFDRALGLAERLGFPYSTRPTLDLLLRTGRWGDRYLPWRNGLRLSQVDAETYGADLGPLQTGIAHRLFHRSGRVDLAPSPLLRAWDALDEALARPEADDALVLIGRREVRSNNSWMHNVPGLVSGRERCVLFLHPKDAEARKITDGDEAVLESRVHRGAVRVKVCDEVMPGVVSLPHGWGHAEVARWQKTAGARAGVSMNDWTDDAEVESVVGQAILNGVPVELHATGGAA
jgi:anaerobic selenocysteine-containing dehydrogenase